MSALYEGFFAYGLRHINQDGAGEGVSSLLLKMCKWGLGAVALAGHLALPGGPGDGALPLGPLWKDSAIAPEVLLVRRKLWGPRTLPLYTSILP